MSVSEGSPVGSPTSTVGGVEGRTLAEAAIVDERVDGARRRRAPEQRRRLLAARQYAEDLLPGVVPGGLVRDNEPFRLVTRRPRAAAAIFPDTIRALTSAPADGKPNPGDGLGCGDGALVSRGLEARAKRARALRRSKSRLHAVLKIRFYNRLACDEASTRKSRPP